MELLYVKIDEILVLDRCRTELGDINKLIESIKTVGLIHPVIICKNRDRKTNKQYKYLLLSGYRRIEAVKAIGNKAIFADLRECIDYASMIRFETAENYFEKYTEADLNNVRGHLQRLKKQWAEMEIEPIILSQMNPMRLIEPAVTESSGRTEVVAENNSISAPRQEIPEVAVPEDVSKKIEEQNAEIEALKKQLADVKSKASSDRRAFDREIQKLIDENIELQIQAGKI